MKALYISLIFILYSLNTLGQKIIDLRTNKDKFLVDSLYKEYIDLDNDTSLRRQLLDWPLFYNQAFTNLFDLLYNDIKAKNVRLNIDIMNVDYFISTTGNIEYILYKLNPIKGKKIQKSDHNYIRSFFEKNHWVELKSTKKFRENQNILVSSITYYILNN
jgi:hypothetical protein